MKFCLILPFVFGILVSCAVDNSLQFNNLRSTLDGLWSFDDESEYDYDSNSIEISNGKAQLKIVDQTHSGTDFNKGTHVGTFWDGDLVTLATASDYSELDPSWTPQWANLTGYWKLDGTVGAITDGSAISATVGSNGVVSGGSSSFVSGKFNQGYYSSNSANQINIGDGTEYDYGTSSFTVSLWVKYPAAPANPFWIIGKGHAYNGTSTCGGGLGGAGAGTGGWGVSTFSTADPIPNLQLFLSDGIECTSTTGIAVYRGVWNHIVVRIDQTSKVASLFLNGIKVTQSISDLGSLSNTSGIYRYLSIGRGAGSKMNATMDEVAIWDVALGDSEVETIYNRQQANYTELSSSWTPHFDKIVGYWKMEGNWLDSSGNGNHGTAIGDATHIAADVKVGSQSGTFDGDGDYIDTGIVGLLNNAGVYSVSLWAKVTTDQAAVSTGTILDQSVGGIREALSYTHGEFRFGSYNGIWSGVSGPALLNRWYHIAATNVAGVKKLYLDGEEATRTNRPYGAGSTQLLIGGNFTGNPDHTGNLDDIAIWNTELNHAEIKRIYNRQKQKYAGTYDSPVIDLGTSGAWTNLDAVTPLPFGKEIVAKTIESLSAYPTLSGDLTNGLVGYWPLNESTKNETTDNTVLGLSLNSNNGTISTGDAGVNKATSGILQSGMKFDGNDRIDISPAVPIVFSSFSISVWVKVDSFTSWKTIFATNDIQCGIIGDVHGVPAQTRSPFCRSADSGGFGYLSSSSKIANLEGTWFHLSYVWDGTKINYYINGRLRDSLVYTYTSPINQIRLGSDGVTGIGGADQHRGELDEVGVWNRPLTSTEVLELYRRGANRVKYQVKSCVDSNCSCKSFNTSPVGSPDDCDGDGTPNNTDTDDIFKAEFIGPGGNGMTSFSELFNRDSSDMTFTCNSNTTDSDDDICVDDEITLSGGSYASSPSFSFFDYPSTARPPDNRYFQYRVIMEAEDNTACGGGPCLPELTSIEIGPTGRYYSGSPVIQNKTSHPIDRALETLKVSNSSGCNMSYQISNDGSNFYYWDGSGWTLGSNVSQSNDLATLNNNLNSFTSQIGIGEFYFKSFLGNSSFGDCELDKVQIIKSRR